MPALSLTQNSETAPKIESNEFVSAKTAGLRPDVIEVKIAADSTFAGSQRAAAAV
jgi:hypothetical protein